MSANTDSWQQTLTTLLLYVADPSQGVSEMGTASLIAHDRVCSGRLGRVSIFDHACTGT